MISGGSRSPFVALYLLHTSSVERCELEHRKRCRGVHLMRFTLSLAAVACCCLGKKNGSMVDPCFLLQHPAGFFLWDTTRSGGPCILAEIPGISQLVGLRRAVGSIADASNSVGGTMSASITVPNDNTSMAQNVRFSACSMAARICDAPGVKAAAFSS